VSVLEQLRLTITAVRRPALRLLLLGYFGYCLARKASRVALVVYAFDVGGVHTASIVAAAQLVPAIVAPPVGSVFGDRRSSESALTLGYVLQAVALVGTGVSMGRDWPLVVTVVLAAGAAAAFTLTRPVYLAALPDVVEHPDELALGNAASTWVDGLASVVGPLVAGTGLLLVGGGSIMVLLGAICLGSALASTRVRTDRPTPASASRVKGAVLEGVRAVTHDRDLRSVAAVTMSMYAVVGLLDVLLVVVVVEILGLDSSRTGGLTAAIGVGAVLGGVTATALAGRARLTPAVAGGALCVGLPVALLGASSAFWLCAALLAVVGAGKSVVTVAVQTLLQRAADERVAVRGLGVQESMVKAGTAAGAALGPLLVVGLGLRGALVSTGVVLPAATLLALASLGRLDARAVVPGSVFTLLRAVPFLALLPVRSVERMARDAVVGSVAQGEAVVQEGEAADRFYVVSRGTAVVTRSDVVLRRLGPGQWFGEIALLRDVPRTATVAAATPLQLVALERDAFLSTLTGTERAHRAATQQVEDHLDNDRRGRADNDGSPSLP
jgi:predicted MFS family arabinose efflux permease